MKEETQKRSFGKFRRKSCFVKTFTNNGELPKYNKRSHLADFFILSKTLSPELNMIGRLTKKGWKPLQPKDLPAVLDVSQSSVSRFLKESKELKIISEVMIDDTIHLFVNPSYAFNGTCLNPLLFWLFKDCDTFKSKLSLEEKLYLDSIISGREKIEVKSMLEV